MNLKRSRGPLAYFALSPLAVPRYRAAVGPSPCRPASRAAARGAVEEPLGRYRPCSGHFNVMYTWPSTPQPLSHRHLNGLLAEALNAYASLQYRNWMVSAPVRPSVRALWHHTGHARGADRVVFEASADPEGAGSQLVENEGGRRARPGRRPQRGGPRPYPGQRLRKGFIWPASWWPTLGAVSFGLVFLPEGQKPVARARWSTEMVSAVPLARSSQRSLLVASMAPSVAPEPRSRAAPTGPRQCYGTPSASPREVGRDKTLRLWTTPAGSSLWSRAHDMDVPRPARPGPPGSSSPRTKRFQRI